MRIFHGAGLASVAVCISFAANAAAVDLTGWQSENFHGSSTGSNWVVQSGNDSVLQTTNGNPTVFFEAGTVSQGTSLSGTFKTTNTDDDFMGFVLGFDAGELNSSSADFWLIDWKRGNQTFSGLGTAKRGLSLSHVTGDTANNLDDDYWQHINTVNEVERGTTLGDTGWVQGQEYTFTMTFTDSLIEVFVDGDLEISHAGTFTDGAFGFYNYSQSQVTYAGVTEDVLPPTIPLPATLPLLAAGLFGFGVISRRRKKS